MAAGPASVVTAGVLSAAGLWLALHGSAGTPTALESEGRAGAFSVTASLSPDAVLRNEKVVLSGTVKPVRTSKDVVVQHRVGESWTTVARRPLDDGGRYRYAFKAKESGEQVYRVRMPKVGAVRSGTSPEQVLTVAEESLVVFEIPPGTGGGDWNTEATKVVAKVGDTLRLVNDDVMTHGLASKDGKPFPGSSGSLPPGESVELVLESAFEGWLFCSVHGQTSQFWIDVVA